MKEIADEIGYMSLLLLVLLTGFVGISLAKQQGKDRLLLFQKEISAGKMPGHPILEGLMILVAATVLITPGFLTDIFGFSLLFPPIRKFLAPLISKMLKSKVTQKNNFTFYSNMREGSSSFESYSKERGYQNGDTFDMPKDRNDKKIE